MAGGIEFAAGEQRVEFAAGAGGYEFPLEWGTPPGPRNSEERAAWVRDNVHRLENDPLRR